MSANEDYVAERRRAHEPTIENGTGRMSDTIEKHPAYGQITASRVQGNAVLYGSDFNHHGYITIAISRSELHRGLSYDLAFPNEELISVALSEAQWARFVSNMNAEGVQCTLEHVLRKPCPSIPEPKDRRDQIVREANACLEEVLKDCETLDAEIEGSKRKTVMRDLIRRIRAKFTEHSGLSFIARQFGEQIEETVEKAKVEVDAYVENRISRAGLAALKGEPPPISLPKQEKKP